MNKIMRILLTNDDGIHGHGLKVLEKIARAISDDVWIVAPELDQSGSSHSLTLRDPLRIRDISEHKFAVTGTPTDCVLIATSHILKDKKPDLILSGVNYGANIAEDVTYSGTIAAAIEGTLLGIRSIALSLTVDYDHPAKWSTAEHFGPEVIKKVLEIDIDPKILININFPNVISASVKGIKATSQGSRQGADNVVSSIDPRGKPYFWIGAGSFRFDTPNPEQSKGTDLGAIHDGYISVSPLSLDLTHQPSFNTLKGVFGS
jgi:5'-nucleotidase